MKSYLTLAASAFFVFAGSISHAEAVQVEVLLEPQEQMKYGFGDGSNHFVLAVRREGIAEGTGPFAGATVHEFGWHDVNPPISGKPRGYLEIVTENGDRAILHWTVSAAFLKGADGPALFDNGVWELVRGTGKFAEQAGVGSLVIRPQGGPNLFILDGEIGDRP